MVSYVVVSFHAHPDDECLLTGGTLARAAADGHRVVLVVATAGGEGLTSRQTVATGSLAEQRIAELQRSAQALGVARVHQLGYGDSGLDGNAGGEGGAVAPAAVAPPAVALPAFARADVEEAAHRLAAILRDERADVVTVYDAAGGYGHPDHVQVHRVGVRAAELAGTPVVLEATVDRAALQRVLRFLHMLRLSPPDWHPDRFAAAFTPRSALTHRVDVRNFVDQKRAAMAAHATQATADTGTRTLAIFLRLPRFVFRWGFGREWFVERGRRASGAMRDDIFSTLRELGPRPGDGGDTRGGADAGR